MSGVEQVIVLAERLAWRAAYHTAADGYRAAGERRPTAAPTARDDRGSR